jgi:hypothetical protein
MINLQPKSIVIENGKLIFNSSIANNNFRYKTVNLTVEPLPQVKAKWEQILSDSNTDRQQAETAIQACYQFAGLSQPRILWAENPLTAMMVLISRSDLNAVGDRMLQQFWDSCHEKIDRKFDREAVRMAMAHVNPRAEIVGDINNIKFDPWGDYFNSLLMRKIAKIYPDLDLAKLPIPLQDYRIAYLSYLDYFYTVGVDIPQVEIFATLARSCGWCWAFENLAIVTPKPTQIEFNDRHEVTAIDYDGVNIVGN